MGYFIGITALFVLLVGTLLYTLIRKRVSAGKFALLLGLRLCFLALLVWLLTDPMITFMKTRSKPQKMYLLVDQSRSMSITDAGENNVARLDYVQKLLFDEASRADALRSENLLVEVIGIGDSVRRNLQPPLEPLAYQSNILENSLSFLDDISDDSRASVYIISDGCSTDKSVDVSGISSKLPLNTVCVGNPEEQVDCMIRSVQAPGEVDIEDTIDFHIQVGTQKIPNGSKLRLLLLDDDNEVLQQKEINTPLNDEVLLSYKPKSAGLHQYTVTVDSYDMDEPYTENNSYKTAVLVEKKDVRIMVIGKPSWDMAFLLRSLRAVRNVRLSVYNVADDTADTIFSLQSLVDQPVEEVLKNLSEQDVLIFCDVPATIFATSDMQGIEKFVENKGGGVWFMGGESTLGSGSYIGTSLTNLLPVFLVDNDYVVQPYRVDLSQIARPHPLTAGFAGSVDFDQVPPLTGINIVQKIKPAAETFFIANTPVGSQRFPLLSVMNYGKGKTALFAGKGLYRWSMEGGNQSAGGDLLTTFVRNVIAWIVSPSENALMHVRLPGIKYDLGEKIHTEAVVLDTTYAPASDAQVKGRVTGPDDFDKPIDFVPVPGEQSGFSTTLLPPKPGKYHLSITGIRTDGTKNTVETDFFVIPSSDEFARLASNTTFLHELADETGGEKFSIDEFADFLHTYNPRPVKEKLKVTRMVVDYPFVLMVLLGLIITEWVVRIKEGLS